MLTPKYLIPFRFGKIKEAVDKIELIQKYITMRTVFKKYCGYDWKHFSEHLNFFIMAQALDESKTDDFLRRILQEPASSTPQGLRGSVSTPHGLRGSVSTIFQRNLEHVVQMQYSIENTTIAYTYSFSLFPNEYQPSGHWGGEDFFHVDFESFPNCNHND
jgi:hypothetical protein